MRGQHRRLLGLIHETCTADVCTEGKGQASPMPSLTIGTLSGAANTTSRHHLDHEKESEYIPDESRWGAGAQQVEGI